MNFRVGQRSTTSCWNRIFHIPGTFLIIFAVMLFATIPLPAENSEESTDHELEPIVDVLKRFWHNHYGKNKEEYQRQKAEKPSESLRQYLKRKEDIKAEEQEKLDPELLMERAMEIRLQEGDTSFSESQYFQPGHIFQQTYGNYDYAMDEGDKMHLALKQAIIWSLEKNTDIKIQQVETRLQSTLIQQAFADFDPIFEFSTDLEYFKNPQNTQDYISSGGNDLTSILNGEPNLFEESNARFKTSLSGKLASGTQYEFKMNLDIMENSLVKDSIYSLYRPEYATFAGITITHPLFRDHGREVNLAPIHIARKNRDIALIDLRRTLLKTIAESIQYYFDFVYAQQELKLRDANVAVYERIVDETRIQVEKAMISIRQLGTARSRLAEATDKRILAESRLMDSRHKLLESIGTDPLEMNPSRIFPEGTLFDEIPPVDYEKSINIALNNDPEYQRILLEMDRDRLEMIIARNEARSRFNIVATLGARGLDGDPASSYISSWERSTPNITLGVVFSRPWSNALALARIEELIQQSERTELTRERLQKISEMRIYGLVQEINTQDKRLQNARELRHFVEAEIDEEEILLEKGEKMISETLEFYEQLYEARIRELAILTSLNQSVIELWLAEGSLLERHGIFFDNELMGE